MSDPSCRIIVCRAHVIRDPLAARWREMSRVFLSVVVPALNEEGCIAAFIDRMRRELERRVPSWEIVVVDDGSTDRTRSIVEREAAADRRIRLITGPHRGKGAALQQGMLVATGEWRFMADADLATPPDNLTRFLALARSEHPPDIVIGSREAPQSQRTGEPWSRHVIGRVFNWIVRAFAVRRIRDTQSGSKLWSAAAADALFPRLTITGFAFDVELLFLAGRAGLDVREVGIVWRGRRDSRVAIVRGAAAFADIIRIRWRWRNTWTIRAYAFAAILAAAIAYDLLRMPVQVFDSLQEILDAQGSPSAWSSFEAALRTTAYLRPLRIAQIKALFDLSDGNYWLAYRGFHAFLIVACLWLFTRALRVRSATELAAAVFALTVLTGMPTFRGTVQEAFPINHFLEIVVCCLTVLNLAQSRGGWRVDAVAGATFVAAALTLESGLLVWVTAVAARMVGMRGISRRGLVTLTLLLGGYFYLRFVHMGSGTPGLSERSAGFMLSVLEPSELAERFGSAPYIFYAYNVIASALAVMFSEPQSGVFVAARSWLQGEMAPRVILVMAASTMTTVLIAWTVAGVVRARGAIERDVRLIAVAGAVIAANAVMSYAYTKDEIMSVAGAFYALAAFAAVRVAIERAASARAAVAAALAVTVLVNAGLWAVPSAGLHHILRFQAFRHRGDWALLPARRHAEGGPAREDRAEALAGALRSQALAMPAPNPRFYPAWANRLWGE